MKLMTNIISTAILATSLTAFNVPQAFAKDVKQISSVKQLSSQDVIKLAFADFTLAMNSTKVENKDIILRQSLTSTIQKLKTAGISKKDLIEYATSDMSAAEAKSFRAQTASIASADLNTSEGQELFEKILMSQSKGSNFLPCGVGFFVSFFATGVGLAFVIVALTSIGDNTRVERQQIEKDKAAIESEIKILKGEGVSEDSYLVSSRRAEIVQLDIEHKQMLDDKAQTKKDTVVYGAVGSALLVTAIVAGIEEGNCHY